MKRFIFALLFVGLGGPAVACSVDIDTVTANQWVGGDGNGYDVFDTAIFYQPLTLEIHSIDGGCPFYMSVAPATGTGSDGALNGPGSSLRYTVYRDATGSQSLSSSPAATDSQVLSGVLSATKSISTFQVAYSIAPQQVVPPGDYTGQITVTFYEGKVGSGILRAQQQVPLTVHIPAVTDISFSEGAFDQDRTSYNLAFGTMHEGDVKGVTLHTRSNSGYRILLRSDNGGVMRQSDPNEDSAVAYFLSVDGKDTSIDTSDTQAIMNAASTDAAGKPHRLDFRIGSTTGASAGDYKDIVRITVLSLK